MIWVVAPIATAIRKPVSRIAKINETPSSSCVRDDFVKETRKF